MKRLDIASLLGCKASRERDLVEKIAIALPSAAIRLIAATGPSL
jgi:hypothetical protein